MLLTLPVDLQERAKEERMLFHTTRLAGAVLIELEKREDERGFFARSFCEREFRSHGLDPTIVQCNVSYNKKRGTLRGMHFQVPPSAEVKVVRCTRGALYDVILDLRPRSRTFLQWVGIELTEENGKMLYIPKGVAHGFQTLLDDTAIFYQMSESYAPEQASGVRWDDPLFGIAWPEADRTISRKDRQCPDAHPGQFAMFADL